MKLPDARSQPEADVIRIVAGSGPNPKVGRFRKLAARCSKVCNADKVSFRCARTNARFPIFK
jgi:hypothetical protein